MDTALLVVVALVAAAGGAVLGFVVRTVWASQTIKAASSEARRIEAEARARQKELILEAKDEKLRLQREAEDEARTRRGELSALESRLLQRDEQLDQRSDMLEQRDRKLIDRERELDKTRDDLARAHGEQVAALERVSGMSAVEAKGILIEAVREEAEHDAVKLARAIERSAREEAQDKARDIVITAMQRVAADHTAEHTVSVVHLPSDEMKGRIIGREGRNIRALEQATGIDLIIDDTPETVILSGFDPVRREIARLAITKLIAGRPDPPGRIEEVVAKARAEVDVVMRQAGEQAAYEAGVPGLPADIIKTLGRLKFRTSYGQNVLKHSVETATSPRSSRPRSARTSRSPRWAASCTTSARPSTTRSRARTPRSAPRSPSATTCRRRSSTRSPRTTRRSSTPASRRRSCRSPTRSARRGPGARGESMETYLKRLEELQAIAESFEGVEKSFAVQAGREVRILVRPEEIDDLTASRLARDIVQEDRGAADLPGPDQGHRHPRDARRGVRQVAHGSRSHNPCSGHDPVARASCCVAQDAVRACTDNPGLDDP